MMITTVPLQNVIKRIPLNTNHKLNPIGRAVSHGWSE